MWRIPPPKYGGTGAYAAQPYARTWRCRHPHEVCRRLGDGVIARALRRLREPEAPRPGA